jgi:Zinc knuckle
LLLNGLCQDVYSEVLQEEHKIYLREQVIAAAQHLYKLNGIAGYVHAICGRSTGETLIKSERSEQAAIRLGKGNMTCYRCDKEGHISKFCP